MHKLVDKHFSTDFPFSKYTAAVFETRNMLVDSYIKQNEDGNWTEIITKKLSEEDTKKIKTDFGYKAYRKS